MLFRSSATASFLRVVSPFDGVVTETLVERGDMATPGLPLVRVEDTSRFRVEARVDQARASALNPGAAIEVVLDSPNGPSVASATIAEIARAVDADAHTVLVKAWLPEGTVARSGTFVRLRLAADTRRSMTVPPEALVTHGQITSAFVIEDGTARLRLVRARGTDIEAGLVEGDTVIVSPPADLTDGQPVSTGGPR